MNTRARPNSEYATKVNEFLKDTVFVHKCLLKKIENCSKYTVYYLKLFNLFQKLPQRLKGPLITN